MSMSQLELKPTENRGNSALYIFYFAVFLAAWQSTRFLNTLNGQSYSTALLFFSSEKNAFAVDIPNYQNNDDIRLSLVNNEDTDYANSCRYGDQNEATV